MPAPLQGVTGEQQLYVKKKDRHKYVRCVIEYAIVGVLAVFGVYSAVFPTRYEQQPDLPAAVDAVGSETAFIAVSYAGLTTQTRSSLVNRDDYAEQLDALAMNGYRTITQQQALSAVSGQASLPDRALMLLTEDGIADTTTLARDALVRNNYIATAAAYAEYLYTQGTRYLSAAGVRSLDRDSYFEPACAGWQLHYINVFDRWGNPFGHLDINEFLSVRQYLRRDYNHWLMDYLRDEDRLRTESVEAMQERIALDYSRMRTAWEKALGRTPGTSILMHANTGMFATEPSVSAENARQLTALFTLNFNRMGSCLNTADASPFDLTRMQVQPWWHVNCMLMHIADDTGDSIRFVAGDAQDQWETLLGASQFKDRSIILTSLPRTTGLMLLRRVRPTDVTLDATLEGNVYGRQAVYLRSDRHLTRGIAVAIDRNVLTISETSGGTSTELFRLDLFDFDGGADRSEEEQELAGLIALNQALMTWDADPVRRDAAAAEHARLTRLRARTVQEGAAPYVPEIDVADRGTRQLSILLRGDHLTVRIDGRTAADLTVTQLDAGQVLLESSPLMTLNDEFSQRNVYEDVYDGVFTNLILRDGSGVSLYEKSVDPADDALSKARDLLNIIVDFVMTHY